MRDLLAKKYSVFRLVGGFGSLWRGEPRAMALSLLVFFLLPFAAFDSILMTIGFGPIEASVLSWPDIQHPDVRFASGLSFLGLGVAGLFCVLKGIAWCLAGAEIASAAAARLGLSKYRPLEAARRSLGKLVGAGALFGLFQFVVFFLKQQIPLANQKDVILFFLVFENIGVIATAFAAAFISDAGAPLWGGFRSGFSMVADELMKNLIIFVAFLLARLFLNLVFQMLLATIPYEWDIIVFQLCVAALYFAYISLFIVLYFRQTRFGDSKDAQV